MALLQAHHCKPRKQQITAGVSYNLVNAKFTCSLCTVELAETEFCEHLEGHLTLKPYVCKYCDRDFSTRGEVCEHLGSFHQQDEQTFMLKLSDRTKDIIQKAKNIVKVFYKPVSVLIPVSNSAVAAIIKATTQNVTTVPGPKQAKMTAPVAGYSRLSSLGSASTVCSTLPAAVSPVSLGSHPHLASQLNSNIVLTCARPQLPSEQIRNFVVLTTQSQTGFVPTTLINVLQTQAPICLSQNVCTPASNTSWRHPFAQKLPAQIVVPVKNLPIQKLNAQRGDIQRPTATLPNLVTHSLHSASPSVAQNVNTRGVHIVTNVSPASVNQKNCYTNRYEDISDGDGHNRGTGSINYSLVDSPYSDEFPSDLSKKTTQPEKSHYNVTVTPLLAAETAVVSSVTHIETLLSERIDKSHDSFTITPLSVAETAVTSSLTQTTVTSSITQAEGLLPESIRNAHDNATFTPLSATETAANPTTLTERLKTCLAANSDIDAVYHFVCNMCRSELADLDKLGLHLQELLLKAVECKHCTSFFLNIFSWKKHMAVEHVDLQRLDCIKRKLLCYERKMDSNVPQQSSQEDIPCLSNIEREAEISDYQCEGTHHESHGMSGAVLDETETIASNVIENSEVPCSRDVELTETHFHHEERDMVYSGNMEDVQTVSKTTSSIDRSNSVKSAILHSEDNPTILEYEDKCCQGVVAKIPLGVQSSSHDNFGQTVSENISTLPYNMTVPLNDHCLNEKAEFYVGEAEAISEICHSRVKHASHSVVANIDASSDLDQATSVESQDGCDVTSVSTNNTVSCKLPQASDCSVGSKDYFNITSTALSLPVTRVSDFASTSAAGFNLDTAETRTILCVSEQNELEYTENTCLPVEIGVDINRQESRHPSVVPENNLRSAVQHDTEHVISNVVKSGGDQAASAAVNGTSISQTVFLSSHTSTVGENSIKEHQQTDVLPSCNINQADEAARIDSVVSVPSVADESILSLQLENRQKPTKCSVFRQTVKSASVIHQNFDSAHDSETKINGLFKEPCTDNRSHYTPDVISVLKTVSQDSGDIANPATNSLGPNHDSYHDIDFSSSKDPACTLQESVGDIAGNYDILENDISYGHDLMHLYIDKRSSTLMQNFQTEKQETKKDGSCDEIHYNKNSLVSTKDGQLYASNKTSACIESRETREENLLNSPSHSYNFMEENNNTASVDQTSIASNVTGNKDSYHTETNGLSDKVSTEQDLSNSLFRCNCGTLNYCFTDGDHNVQPQDKSPKISFTGKCAKCRLVTEESSHPVNTTEHVISKTVDAEPSEDSKSLLEKFMRALEQKISENGGKINQLERVCGNRKTRSKVDPQESISIKPDVLSGHSKTCVGPEISDTNPVLKSDLETAADNGSIVLSESKNTARDFTTSNREMLDVHCKKELEAGQGEEIITSKLLRINSKKNNKKLDRAVAVSQSPKVIQGADVAILDSARFRCSACPFVTSQSYTELKHHVKSQHPQDKSARVCRICSRILQNAAEQSERWQNATLSLQEVQNNDVTMSNVKDEITTPQHTLIHSETSIGYCASENKSEVNSESSYKIHKEWDIGIYKCIRPKCTFTCKWNLEKMKAHIKSKHPYYSCGYCKAPYTTLACLYKHIQCLHRSKKPRVMEGTVALELLFKRVDFPYNGQGAECTDVKSQTPAKRKKRSQSSIINYGKKFEANTSSEVKVLKMKGHTPLKSCDVNVTSSQQNQPRGDSKTERTLKDNDDSHSAAAQGLKMPQWRLIHSKSESILKQISKDISPVPEHEVSSAEKQTVTSKTAAMSNNGDSLSAKSEKNLLKATISSKFAKTFDHTHIISPTVSLHTNKTVAPSATLLLSPQSAENNTRRNKVTENHESDCHSSAQNVRSNMRPLGPVTSQDTVRKENSSAATSNNIDINVSLNSATSVQPSGTVKKQELNSVDISDKQELSNRLGNVHETLPEICSETASCMSDTVLLPHTMVASAIVTSKTQDQKHCGTLAATQLETKTAAEGNENKNSVPEDLRTAHLENNLSLQNEYKTDSKFENAPTTDIMSFSQRDYPFRCTACGRILKCVKDTEKHYNSDHPRDDVQLTERKSGFVYSNSGQCLQWKDVFKATTDSYLCSYCEFRSMKRSDVEEHLRRVHPTREVRVFTLCKPNTDRYSTRSKVTALPHEASSSNSPTSSYVCNVCNDVKNSEFQFRLHLASHPCFKHTTQLTAGASFLCHTCGYITESRSDFAQHTRKHVSERRFHCFMCEHDSHNKKSMRAHIKSVRNKTVDDDIGIIYRDKQRNVDLRPRLVNIDPQVVLIDPFRQQPNYLQRLLLADDIKTLDLTGCSCPDILTSEENVYAK